jgi:hypothetical protein
MEGTYVSHRGKVKKIPGERSSQRKHISYYRSVMWHKTGQLISKMLIRDSLYPKGTLFTALLTQDAISYMGTFLPVTVILEWQKEPQLEKFLHEPWMWKIKYTQEVNPVWSGTDQATAEEKCKEIIKILQGWDLRETLLKLCRQGAIIPLQQGRLAKPKPEQQSLPEKPEPSVYAKYILDHPNDITPVESAIYGSQVDVLTWLLKDVYLSSTWSVTMAEGSNLKTIIRAACYYGNVDILDVIWKNVWLPVVIDAVRTATTGPYGLIMRDGFRAAIRKGHIPILEYMLNAYPLLKDENELFYGLGETIELLPKLVDSLRYLFGTEPSTGQAAGETSPSTGQAADKASPPRLTLKKQDIGDILHNIQNYQPTNTAAIEYMKQVLATTPE